MNRFTLRRLVDLDARAKALEDQALHDKAISLREEVYRLARDEMGTDHLWGISRLLGLAASCRRCGDVDRAEMLYRDGICRLDRRRDEAGSKARYDLAHALNALGVLYCETERPTAGVEAFERALATLVGQDTWGEHIIAPVRAAILNNLASAHHALQHWERAEACYVEVLTIHRQAGAVLEQAHCHCDLAELAVDAERFDDCESQAEAALLICRDNTNENHPMFVETLIRLARLERQLCHPGRAAAILEEAVVKLQQAGDLEDDRLTLCLDQMSDLRYAHHRTSSGSDG